MPAPDTAAKAAVDRVPLIHIFIDHSNLWGGARLSSRIHHPKLDDARARLSVRHLDSVLVSKRKGVNTKIVSGGIPPGMEGMWLEYEKAGYDTQRLFRGADWKERGVDHSLIGHMWRLLARFQGAPIVLVLASGDGKSNEFGTSFFEIVEEVLTHAKYATWMLELASFDWKTPGDAAFRSPTNQRMKGLVDKSPRGRFVNLFDHYDRLVYHAPEEHPAKAAPAPAAKK
jgi:hypothetical protein